MPRADFYLIGKPRFRDDPLLLVCELARRAFTNAQATVILVRSQDQAESLDARLWDFSDDAFIPHQIAGDDDDDITPVLIVPPVGDQRARQLCAGQARTGTGSRRRRSRRARWLTRTLERIQATRL